MDIVYCGNCTLPGEYCRYGKKKKVYTKCLLWWKKNHPIQLLEFAENDSVVAELLHAQNEQNAKTEEKANAEPIIQQEIQSNVNNNNNNIKQKSGMPEIPAIVEFKEVDELQQTIIDKKLETDEQIIDISQKLQQLSSMNTNEISDESECDLPSNTNKTFTGKVPKGRKRKRKKRKNKKGRKKQQSSEDEEPNEGNDYNINREKDMERDRKRKQNRNRKTKYDASGGYDERERRMSGEENNSNMRSNEMKSNVKNDKKAKRKIIQVLIDNRKGNKKVTLVRGLMELGMKAKKAQSEFRKKFATGVGIQQSKSFNGQEIVLQGDRRYDIMKWLHEHHKVPQKLLFYRLKSGLQPAYNAQGFCFPPPGR